MSIRDDSIKEELKAQYEFLRIYSIFLIGLAALLLE